MDEAWKSLYKLYEKMNTGRLTFRFNLFIIFLMEELNRKKLLKRIMINPRVKKGKAVINGTELTVQFILKLLASNKTFKDIMDEYKGVTKEDILACLLFAAEMLDLNYFNPLSILANMHASSN